MNKQVRSDKVPLKASQFTLWLSWEHNTTAIFYHAASNLID